MKEEKNKILTQWIFPTLVMVVVIFVMIINFNIRSGVMAVTTVSRELTVIAERYAAVLETDLAVLSSTTKTVADALSKFDGVKNEENMLKSLYTHTPAYMVVLTDGAGNGFTHTGERVNLSASTYFSNIQEVGFNNFIFVDDDFVSGYKAIIYVAKVPGDDGQILISYYPIENMGDVIARNDFDGDVLYMLIGGNGELLAFNKGYTGKMASGNLLSQLRMSSDDELRKELRRMDIGLKNHASGTFKVEFEEEARTLIYSPLSMNDWFIIVGATEKYVTGQEKKVWEYTRRTFLNLAIVISVFCIVIVVINMITKIRGTAKTKDLMEKADTDLLTGLLNKVATERKVQEYMDAFPNEQALMFVLDIDNFKKINDTMGHAFGDEVLRSLGQQITPIFRSTDIIGRIGGDELIILLKNIYQDENLLREAEKVARFFHEFKAGEYVKYSATASIGCAIFPRDGKDFESMYKAADQALYTAKKRGKNQLAFYHDTFDAVVIKS